VTKFDKSWILDPKPAKRGRALCAGLGIIAVAVLNYLGLLPTEKTMLSGIAYGALGAIGGVVVYGVYDFIQKTRNG